MVSKATVPLESYGCFLIFRSSSLHDEHLQAGSAHPYRGVAIDVFHCTACPRRPIEMLERTCLRIPEPNSNAIEIKSMRLRCSEDFPATSK